MQTHVNMSSRLADAHRLPDRGKELSARSHQVFSAHFSEINRFHEERRADFGNAFRAVIEAEIAHHQHVRGRRGGCAARRCRSSSGSRVHVRACSRRAALCVVHLRRSRSCRTRSRRWSRPKCESRLNFFRLCQSSARQERQASAPTGRLAHGLGSRVSFYFPPAVPLCLSFPFPPGGANLFFCVCGEKALFFSDRAVRPSYPRAASRRVHGWLRGVVGVAGICAVHCLCPLRASRPVRATLFRALSMPRRMPPWLVVRESPHADCACSDTGGREEEGKAKGRRPGASQITRQSGAPPAQLCSVVVARVRPQQRGEKKKDRRGARRCARRCARRWAHATARSARAAARGAQRYATLHRPRDVGVCTA